MERPKVNGQSTGARDDLSQLAVERHSHHQRREPLSEVPGFYARFRQMNPESRLRALILSADQLYRNAIDDHDEARASRLLRKSNSLLDRLDRLEDPLHQHAQAQADARHRKIAEQTRLDDAHKDDWKIERDYVHRIMDKHPEFRELVRREMRNGNQEP